ncbi:MAG: NYN domain-containing protein, partial [Clostridia bacterium]|nr:NYN domain-containing protein [Clostridia bacterium]
ERPEYLLVDGYNIIYAWSDSFGIGQVDLDIARRALSDMLDNYAATRKVHIILVFDAYKVRHNPGSTERYGNIEIIYTREAQTADSYIEKLAHELSALNRVRVATGDGLEQLIILGSGALRITARELLEEINASEAEIRKLAEQMNRSKARTNLGEALRDALQKKEKP